MWRVILICMALWQPPEPTKIPIPYPRYTVYVAVVSR